VERSSKLGKTPDRLRKSAKACRDRSVSPSKAGDQVGLIRSGMAVRANLDNSALMRERGSHLILKFNFQTEVTVLNSGHSGWMLDTLRKVGLASSSSSVYCTSESLAHVSGRLANAFGPGRWLRFVGWSRFSDLRRDFRWDFRWDLQWSFVRE